MKKIIFLLLLSSLCAACNTLEESFSFGAPRITRKGETGTAGSRGPETAKCDTSIYVAAVRFSDDYGWLRDSLWGSVPYDVLLFKDGVLSLTVSSGSNLTSPDPDLIHLIGGHLYTERANSTQTVLSRDGEEILRFNGREVIKGLLFDGDDICTLSSIRSTGGFTFRRNGEVVMKSKDGELFGSLCDPSYGKTGALYLDNGVQCFCYNVPDGKGRKYKSVRDESDSTYNYTYGRILRDMKIIYGGLVTAPASIGIYSSDDWRIFTDVGGYTVAGNMTNGGEKFAAYMRPYKSVIADKLCGSEAMTFVSWNTAAAVSDENESVKLYENGVLKWTAEGRNAVMTPSCCAWRGGKLAVAATALDADEIRLWDGKEEIDPIKLHGYACAMEIVVTPAR